MPHRDAVRYSYGDELEREATGLADALFGPGVTSFQDEATPTCGLSQSASVMPTARSMARAAALSGPSVTSWLRSLRLLGIAKTLGALTLAGAVGTVAGCSVAVKPHTAVSGRSLEVTIARELMASYNIPQPLVRCPSSVPARPGTALSCTTELDGQALRVDVTITGARGQARMEPASAVVAKGAADAQLADSLAPKFGKSVQVFCNGPALLVVPPGGTFECQADSAGIERQVVVTVASLSGRLSYRVLPYQK
jgi:Domain of unknown function (DUF4333)